ncbi:hypothetical protein Q5752_002164 [Cryptotrichosporon argae]
MKRAQTSSPSPDAAAASPKPPVTPPKKKTKSPMSPMSPKGTNSPSSASVPASPSSNGTWTPASRAEFMDRIIAAGYRAVDLDALADEMGFNKKQLVNQLTPGRQGSLRDKAVKAVSAEQGR